MPELPEVQSVVNFFKPIFINQKIRAIDNPNKYSKVFETHSLIQLNRILKGKKITDVWRRGKYIVLDTTEGHLSIHLRMTGQLLSEITKDETLKHISASIFLENGKRIFFKDYRKFGRIYFFKSITYFDKKLGCEPLSSNFTFSYFHSGIKKSKGIIKSRLLNQSFVAGLGNIYVDEALWMAKIHPQKICCKISKIKIQNLFKAIPNILNRAIDFNGTTFINFSYGNEVSGDFKDYLNVFGKQGSACPRCQNKIEKIFVGQRGTHFCSKCQIK